MRSARYVLAGTVASVGVLIGSVGAGPIDGVVLPDGPFGLWRPADGARGWFAVLTVVSVCALAVSFVGLYRLAAAGEVGVATVARASVAWCLPVLPGPPLLSLDAYSYAAQGWMLLSRLDPYSAGPQALGGGPILDAVAPVWRGTAAPYGPLALALVRHVAGAADGNLPATVYLLRLLAVLAVVGASVAALRLTPPERRPVALVLVAANPLVVLHLVGGVHLDAILTGLAAVVVLAVDRGRWVLAAVAAATALAVKLPGLVLVGYVLLSRVRLGGWRVIRTVAVAAAVLVGYAQLVPNGWGWLDALDVPGLVRHPYDPTTILGGLLYVLGLPVEFTEAVSLARTLAAAAAALLVAVLLWRASGSVPVGTAAVLVGLGLEAVALAAPTVHPWYLVWGLALVATGGRRWIVALSVAACFTALPDPLVSDPRGLALTLGLLAMALASIVAPTIATAARRSREPLPGSGTGPASS